MKHKIHQPHNSIAIIGAGAAGVFAALCLRKLAPQISIVLLEQTSNPLAKVRKTGGGRCNLTNACFDPKVLSSFYPRGGSFLLPLFMSFQPKDTIQWFEEHGVALKEEKEGRIFPVSNSSETIVSCLLEQIKKSNIQLETNTVIKKLSYAPEGILIEEDNRQRCFESVLIATGSAPKPLSWLINFGIAIEPQAPSLFSFTCPNSFLLPLSGVSVDSVEIEMLNKKTRGPILLTHWGFSGPAVLKLSSFLAKELAANGYKAPLTIDWLPAHSFPATLKKLETMKQNFPSKSVATNPFCELCNNLWKTFTLQTGIQSSSRWAELSKNTLDRLSLLLKKSHWMMEGKTIYKQEFVTAGGVSVDEVYSKTLEAKRIQGLFFAGEVLDIDGLTGGFNLQAAWTTGYIAACGIKKRNEDRKSIAI